MGQSKWVPGLLLLGLGLPLAYFTFLHPDQLEVPLWGGLSSHRSGLVRWVVDGRALPRAVFDGQRRSFQYRSGVFVPWKKVDGGLEEIERVEFTASNGREGRESGGRFPSKLAVRHRGELLD